MTTVEQQAAPNPATTRWVPVGPGMAGIPTPVVSGQWIKGAGGAAVWAGITPADVANIPYGTSLPASPYNGQEAILVNDVANPAYQWRFRYNAGSTSSFKWEFIGGSEWQAAVAAQEQTASLYQNYVDLSGPSLTVLRAGDYIAQFTLEAHNDTALSGCLCGLGFGAGAVADSDLTWAMSSTAGQELSLGQKARLNGVAVGDLIRIRYCALLGGTVTFSRRQLLVQPVRVS